MDQRFRLVIPGGIHDYHVLGISLEGSGEGILHQKDEGVDPVVLSHGHPFHAELILPPAHKERGLDPVFRQKDKAELLFHSRKAAGRIELGIALRQNGGADPGKGKAVFRVLLFEFQETVPIASEGPEEDPPFPQVLQEKASGNGLA